MPSQRVWRLGEKEQTDMTLDQDGVEIEDDWTVV